MDLINNNKGYVALSTLLLLIAALFYHLFSDDDIVPEAQYIIDKYQYDKEHEDNTHTLNLAPEENTEPQQRETLSASNNNLFVAIYKMFVDDQLLPSVQETLREFSYNKDLDDNLFIAFLALGSTTYEEAKLSYEAAFKRSYNPNLPLDFNRDIPKITPFTAFAEKAGLCELTEPTCSINISNKKSEIDAFYRENQSTIEEYLSLVSFNNTHVVNDTAVSSRGFDRINISKVVTAKIVLLIEEENLNEASALYNRLAKLEFKFLKTNSILHTVVSLLVIEQDLLPLFRLLQSKTQKSSNNLELLPNSLPIEVVNADPKFWKVQFSDTAALINIGEKRIEENFLKGRSVIEQYFSPIVLSLLYKPNSVTNDLYLRLNLDKIPQNINKKNLLSSYQQFESLDKTMLLDGPNEKGFFIRNYRNISGAIILYTVWPRYKVSLNMQLASLDVQLLLHNAINKATVSKLVNPYTGDKVFFKDDSWCFPALPAENKEDICVPEF
ncbi:hypothetical protein [Thalassotalea agarivorans]|uniref:Uncharacterized protein n=1 Tax=Thalassotalea agarivorans TaxID=349064 RepID=A0A1I0G984_THASX|nr:hypothetical protein [Thalassotalea agarivorans]SET67409.1 hypothetical protein SAMN05660429_02365 [Thalassotalea agarivorans]